MAASTGFAIVITAICQVLVMILLESLVNSVELGVDILGRISNDSSKLLVRQRVVSILCQNRFLNSF